jgi:hypothetical protein
LLGLLPGDQHDRRGDDDRGQEACLDHAPVLRKPERGEGDQDHRGAPDEGEQQP